MAGTANKFINNTLFFAFPALGGGDEHESDRKTLYSLSFFMSLGAFFWAVFLVWFDLWTLTLIPGAYMLFTALNLILYFPSNPLNSRLFQVAISLLLPFVMQWSIGGYYASGLVMLWSAVSFLAVLVLEKKRYTYTWMVLFIFLFSFSFAMDNHFLGLKPEVITENISRVLLLVNLLMIGAIIFIVAEQRMNLDHEMITRLQSANRDLAETRTELEEKVGDRTRDLETSLLLLQETKNEIKRALSEAREATDSRSYFLTNISHEIRTPLNAILGYAQILSMKSREARIPEEVMRHINGIQDSGNLLMDLVNNVLDITRMDSGKLSLSLESVNIRQLVKRSYEVARSKAESKGVHCSYYLDPQVPEMIETDGSRLSQILLNLLSNAVKFTPEGKNVRLEVRREIDHMVVEVTDEGVGIAPVDLERIFEPFTQASAEITRKFGGTGLGLSIVKRLVKLFRGEIKVKSNLGAGSTFSVMLPVIPAIDTNIKTAEAAPLARMRFIPGQKILVVEDNPVNVQVLTGFLQEVGLQVIAAQNGKEGIDAAITHRPDVILMDIHMPVMDGLEALKVLVGMETFRNTPIICLTADVFGDHRKNYLSLGFSDHLTKPVDFRDILVVLEKYLVPESA